MLTVICWQWRSTGWRGPYTHHNVNALQAMVAAHLKIPHRFICVTDTPQRKGYECEVFPLWNEKYLSVATQFGKPNCYQRLKMFDPKVDKVFGDRFVSIDLDCVIFDDITPMLDVPDDFRIIKGVAAPYNGSMWLLNRGARPRVYRDFDRVRSPIEAASAKTVKGKPYYGSDQAWLSYKLPGEKTWEIGKSGYYPYASHLRNKAFPSDARIVFFAGAIKPWHDEVRETAPECWKTYREYYAG